MSTPLKDRHTGPMSDRVKRAWSTLAGKVGATLAPPASPNEIEDLQAAVGHSLPEALVASLSIHNGCEDWFDGDELLSATDIQSEWALFAEVAAELVEEAKMSGEQPDTSGSSLWTSKMLPITRADGDSYQIDLVSGAVWYYVNYSGYTKHPIAPSFAALLEHYAACVSDGAYREEHGCLWLAPPIDRSV